MEREYVISFNHTVQISPNDFEVFRASLKVTEATTIGQIREWYLKRIAPNTGSDYRESCKMENLFINQLDNPNDDGKQQ